MSGVPLAIPDGLAQSVDHGVQVVAAGRLFQGRVQRIHQLALARLGSIRARAAGAVRAVAAISAGRPAISPACVLAPGEKQALTAFHSPARPEWKRLAYDRPTPDGGTTATRPDIRSWASRAAGWTACRRPAGFLAL